MAHFARLDEQNMVTTVIVISNDDIIDNDGNESEALGIALCENLVGPGPWVQTSYNHNIRGQYAAIGYKYDADNDVFIAPKPFPSWVLDKKFRWTPPKPLPDGGWRVWKWNEEIQDFDQGDE